MAKKTSRTAGSSRAGGAKKPRRAARAKKPDPIAALRGAGVSKKAAGGRKASGSRKTQGRAKVFKKITRADKDKTRQGAASLSPAASASSLELPTPSPEGPPRPSGLGELGAKSRTFKDLEQKANKKLALDLKQLQKRHKELRSDSDVLCAELTSAEANVSAVGDMCDGVDDLSRTFSEFPEKNFEKMGANLDKTFNESMKRLKERC